MSLTAIEKHLYKLSGADKPDFDCKCYRDLGQHKIYSRIRYKNCFSKTPDYTEHYLWDVKNKALYRIRLGDFKNINEFIQALKGVPMAIEPKQLVLLARKIKDSYRKDRLNLSDDLAQEPMRLFIYQTSRGKLESLEMLARHTKNLDIAAEIKEIGESL